MSVYTGTNRVFDFFSCPFLLIRQHFLYFFPLPHGQGAFRPIFDIVKFFSYFDDISNQNAMQLRYITNLSADEYVSRQAWKNAVLDICPLHPGGGCKFARHGTYDRKVPTGTKIARWYCPDGHQTFGLIPDCLCSRLSGSLIYVEAVIDEVENSSSQNAATDKIRLDIDLPGALRWIRRRLFMIKATLTILITSCPFLFADCQPNIHYFRSNLDLKHVLPELRGLPDLNLYCLPPPVGFGPRQKKIRFQQQTGTDPPFKNM